MWRAAVHCTLRGTTSGDEIGRRAVLEQSRARSSWLFGTGSASTGRAPKGKDDLSRDATSVRSGNRRSRLQAEVAEREAFEARFPPETFSGIAEAIGLPPEPEILSGLRRSLLETFYFFYAISSGESPSREEWISGLTELRDAARSLSKSLRYSGAWITVGSLGKAEDEPMYDEKFRATVRSLAAKAEKKIVELKSRRDQPGRP
jgi:hypothetical protein